ncbi:MAG: XTP/dITP diphosphatase [bacterium]|nr:XTP/dITP diphosphatase [bacterium]
MMKLVIATKNKNKIIEIQNKFAGVEGLELISLNGFENVPDVEENGATFEENALKKAREISQFTNMPVLADDSGIVVDALDGRPGIYSARYGQPEAVTDEDRNRLLLKEMDGVKEEGRTARFVCVIAIAHPGGEEKIARGECEGIIAASLKGDHGFGYDPIFFLPEYGKTMAEIPLEEKNKISHRARALDKAKDLL